MRTLLIIITSFLFGVLNANAFSYEGISYYVIDEEAGTCGTNPGKKYIGTDNKYHYVAGNNVWGDIIIPDKVFDGNKSYVVTHIPRYSFYECSIHSIKLPDTVKEIGDFAFNNCESLISVDLGNSVESVGIFAFLNCLSLKNITIPSSLSYISEGMFRHCATLNEMIHSLKYC